MASRPNVIPLWRLRKRGPGPQQWGRRNTRAALPWKKGERRQRLGQRRFRRSGYRFADKNMRRLW